MAKVSIITPTLNSGSSLQRCLLSLAELQLDFEHIVVDGGSRDATLEILRAYKRANLTVLHEIGSGIFGAMNIGAACAKGEWLWFLNSDDYFATDYISEFQCCFSEIDDSVQVLVGWAKVVDGSRSWLWTSKLSQKLLIRLRNPCHQSIIMRKDAFDHMGGFSKRFKLAADFDLMARIVRSGFQVRHLNFPLCVFSAGGKSWSDLSAEAERLSVVFRVFGFMRGLVALICAVKVSVLKLVRRWF